jgi:hypothetical protein
VFVFKAMSTEACSNSRVQVTDGQEVGENPVEMAGGPAGGGVSACIYNIGVATWYFPLPGHMQNGTASFPHSRSRLAGRALLLGGSGLPGRQFGRLFQNIE